MSLKKIVAFNIRKYRAEAGLSQKQLADEAGITPVHINKIEMDCRNITLDTLERISIALGVPLTDLIQNTKVRTRKSPERLKQSIKDTIRVLNAYVDSLDD